MKYILVALMLLLPPLASAQQVPNPVGGPAPPAPAANGIALWEGGVSKLKTAKNAAGVNILGVDVTPSSLAWGNPVMYVGAQGGANTFVAAVDANQPPNTPNFPVALIGSARLAPGSTGNHATAIYGEARLQASSGNTNAGEFTAKNMVDNTGVDDMLPPNEAFGSPTKSAKGVNIACGTAGSGGAGDCSVALHVGNETGSAADWSFKNGIYVGIFKKWGIVVEEQATGTQTSALFKNNGTGYAAQLLMSAAPTGNAALIVDNSTEGPQAAILYNGHMVAKQYKATGHGLVQPSIGACGTGPTLGTNATDMSGYIAAGTGTTSCAVTFGTAFLVTPACVATGLNVSGFSITAMSTAGFTVASAGLAGSTFSYICMPQGG